MPCLILRTLIVASWLVALVVHGDPSVTTAAVGLGLVAIWACALLRDNQRHAH